MYDESQPENELFYNCKLKKLVPDIKEKCMLDTPDNIFLTQSDGLRQSNILPNEHGVFFDLIFNSISDYQGLSAVQEATDTLLLNNFHRVSVICDVVHYSGKQFLFKYISSTQIETAIKTKNLKTGNEIVNVPEVVFEQWEIKSEENDLTDGDFEVKENSLKERDNSSTQPVLAIWIKEEIDNFDFSQPPLIKMEPEEDQSNQYHIQHIPEHPILYDEDKSEPKKMVKCELEISDNELNEEFVLCTPDDNIFLTDSDRMMPSKAKDPKSLVNPSCRPPTSQHSDRVSEPTEATKFVKKTITNVCQYGRCLRERQMGVRFYSFPTKDPSRCKIWILNCGNADLLDMPSKRIGRFGICEAHFSESSFVNETHHRLNFSAVPEYFRDTSPLVPNILGKVEQCEEFEQYQELEGEQFDNTTQSAAKACTKNEPEVLNFPKCSESFSQTANTDQSQVPLKLINQPHAATK